MNEKQQRENRKDSARILLIMLNEYSITGIYVLPNLFKKKTNSYSFPLFIFGFGVGAFISFRTGRIIIKWKQQI
jgi:hypothetical protein